MPKTLDHYCKDGKITRCCWPCSTDPGAMVVLYVLMYSTSVRIQCLRGLGWTLRCGTFPLIRRAPRIQGLGSMRQLALERVVIHKLRCDISNKITQAAKQEARSMIPCDHPGKHRPLIPSFAASCCLPWTTPSTWEAVSGKLLHIAYR
jgi:hypothetical protein